jgi:hypothetical protein
MGDYGVLPTTLGKYGANYYGAQIEGLAGVHGGSG